MCVNMCNSGDEPNENADCDGPGCEEERVLMLFVLCSFTDACYLHCCV